MSGAVTVRLPGRAARMLQDSNYPIDEPAIWVRYRQGQITRHSGHGYSIWATLSRADWRDIADHLQSVVDCLAEMQPTERGDDGKVELRAGRIALSRIGEACGVASGQPWLPEQLTGGDGNGLSGDG